jgi:hypothetical protein
VAGFYKKFSSNDDCPMARSTVLNGSGYSGPPEACGPLVIWGNLRAFAVRKIPWRTANTPVCRAPYPMAHDKGYL